jgi:hypothetical protein
VHVKDALSVVNAVAMWLVAAALALTDKCHGPIDIVLTFAGLVA